jgi:hypothetical protein
LPKGSEEPPASPYRAGRPSFGLQWSPAVAGIWLLLGIFILVWMRLSGNASWLSKAADIIEEREESQAVESK